MTGKTLKPRIIDYDNYRKFLSDWYTYLKSSPSVDFSFQKFSNIAGFRSASTIKLVIDGKRNLTTSAAWKTSTALKLNKIEGDYFVNLVLHNQAKKFEEKKYYADKLTRSSLYRKTYPLKRIHYNSFDRWYYLPIREMVTNKDFREDPKWIARTLSPAILPAEASQALKELEQIGMLQRDSKGKLVQSNGFMTTGDEMSSSSLTQFHHSMIEKGGEAIERFKREDRDISSITVGLSLETKKEVKAKIAAFRKELLKYIAEAGGNETVCQLNFQLFPLRKEGEE